MNLTTICLALLDGAELEVSAELLVPPSREHVFDRLLLGMERCHRLDQDDAPAIVYSHDTLSLVSFGESMIHQMNHRCQ